MYWFYPMTAMTSPILQSKSIPCPFELASNPCMDWEIFINSHRLHHRRHILVRFHPRPDIL